MSTTQQSEAAAVVRTERFGAGALVPDWIERVEPFDSRLIVTFAVDVEVDVRADGSVEVWPLVTPADGLVLKMAQPEGVIDDRQHVIHGAPTKLSNVAREELDAIVARWNEQGTALDADLLGTAGVARLGDERATGTTPSSFDLLVDFLAWLHTREEIVGPFSRIHHPDPRLAPRLAAEYLAAQA